MTLASDNLFLRSIDDDKCPMSNKRIKPHGDRHNPTVSPCVVLSDSLTIISKCIYLEAEYSGILNTTVVCKFNKRADN